MAAKSRRLTAGVVLAALELTGVALRPVEVPVGREMRAREPVLRVESVRVRATEILMQGLLGGFRAAAADVVWLEACGRLEERDLPETESLMQLVTVIDPRPLYFWVNGARIMAYDMPAWRPESVEFNREQAGRALGRLQKARTFHPDSAALWIEQANIEFNRLGDVAAAAESYRRAWEQPGAPYYAARLHAELLRRLGRKTEALAWLVKLHPQLPLVDESAGAELVLARIRELERELAIPSGQSYTGRLSPSRP